MLYTIGEVIDRLDMEHYAIAYYPEFTALFWVDRESKMFYSGLLESKEKYCGLSLELCSVDYEDETKHVFELMPLDEVMYKILSNYDEGE